MSQTPHAPDRNHILAALPSADYERLAPHLERVEMYRGQTLYRAGERLDYVYFPIRSMISLVSEMADGSSVEVGIVGFEGMAGLSLVLGVELSPHTQMVQIPDGGLRLRAEVLIDEFRRYGALHDLLLRYTQGLMLHTAQLVACNRVHHVEERLARWLLMSRDRCVCDELPLTQEFLSLMLGVRRAGVTEAALTLQADGYIHYTRGHITITDRAGLEGASCLCYGIMREEFDRLTASAPA
ncbi:MAG TPA: Crp/Fnr family transcriptional regulator [Pyrinomonadaceae bacterium]|jgi:CRP-like cAMP-binding protein